MACFNFVLTYYISSLHGSIYQALAYLYQDAYRDSWKWIPVTLSVVDETFSGHKFKSRLLVHHFFPPTFILSRSFSCYFYCACMSFRPEWDPRPERRLCTFLCIRSHLSLAGGVLVQLRDRRPKKPRDPREQHESFPTFFSGLRMDDPFGVVPLRDALKMINSVNLGLCELKEQSSQHEMFCL